MENRRKAYRGKKEILKNWSKIVDPSTFEILMRICKEIIYYSPDLTEMKFTGNYSAFKLEEERKTINLIILREKEDVLENLASFKEKETKFLPLRTKDRAESSANIFFNFRHGAKIPVHLTSLDKVDFI